MASPHPASLRAQITSGHWSSEDFCNRFEQVPSTDRDAWWNQVLALDDITDDGGELPRGCVPYLPSPVDVLRRVVAHAPVRSTDVFVDVGCGVGRAALLVHLLTGARVIGIDVQTQLVNSARATAARLNLRNVEFVAADACERAIAGSVYFLYCPFGAERTSACLNTIRRVVASRSVAVACLDMVLPPCDWLAVAHEWPDLSLLRSVSS